MSLTPDPDHRSHWIVYPGTDMRLWVESSPKHSLLSALKSINPLPCWRCAAFHGAYTLNNMRGLHDRVRGEAIAFLPSGPPPKGAASFRPEGNPHNVLAQVGDVITFYMPTGDTGDWRRRVCLVNRNSAQTVLSAGQGGRATPGRIVIPSLFPVTPPHPLIHWTDWTSDE